MLLMSKTVVENMFVRLFCLIFAVQMVFGASVASVEDERFLDEPQYVGNLQLGEELNRLVRHFSEFAKLHVIGRSLEGRDLYVLQIRKNVNQPRPLMMPMFKYVANMHGDEALGRQLLIYLAEYLLYNYNASAEVTSLVDNTDIFLLPSMNPDGYERSFEGNCDSLPQYVGRINAAGIDLNRDFPDRLDNSLVQKLKSSRRQPETVAVMEWIVRNPFVLSANLHGGAVVASYPYDNSERHRTCCQDSLTPDDRVFKHLANTYAGNHPTMRRGLNCNESFPRGVTNGAYWYELDGGMQDFNYIYSNCFEITLELSCCKFPQASELPKEWNKNKRSLIEFMKTVHIGAKGLVADQRGNPIPEAEIIVQGLEEKPMRTNRRGEFWRLLMPGKYNIQATAFGYQPSPLNTIEITATGPTEIYFNLQPLDEFERLTQMQM